MKVGIYARYSSEMQNERSIEDQVVLCREFAARHGWTIGETYADYAVSGSSVHGRFAFERLAADAKRRAITVILAEDLDRLSRNQSDIASFYERMTFAGVEIWSVADGRISEMHIGLKGTMSALFLRNLALKTHRGLSGRVREGKFAGGRCYGYRVSATGEREIHEQEAEIVRRIFAEAAKGATARDIATDLNDDRIPGPRGGVWNFSTLQGSKSRANGVLRNELYTGVMVWNRQRFIRDPDTGKRVSRVNSLASRQQVSVPELRIVDEETWTRVQTLLAQRSYGSGPQARRPKHLFSGLVRCGKCNGSFIIAGSARGVHRFACSTVRGSGTCDNGRSISTRVLEDGVLGAIESHLLDPAVVQAATKGYADEMRRLRAGRRDRQTKIDQRIAQIDVELARAVELVVRGHGSDALGRKMQELEAEKASLARPERHEAEIIGFNPSIADRYRDMVRSLQRTLTERVGEMTADVIEEIRRFVDMIVIFPRGDAQNRDIELHGQIGELIQRRPHDGFVGPLVAGARFELATFRL